MTAPGRRRAIGTRAEPDWAVIHRELVRWLSVTMRQSHAPWQRRRKASRLRSVALTIGGGLHGLCRRPELGVAGL